MVTCTRDTGIRREQRIRQVLTVAPATLAIIVGAAMPAAPASTNSASPAAHSAPQSAPSMTAAEKEHALTEFMRRDAAGEKIDPALLKAFIEAQNQGATSGIAIGQTAPAFELKDQNGRTHTLKSLMGRKGALLVFTRSADW
jgi:hypothetical protein